MAIQRKGVDLSGLDHFDVSSLSGNPRPVPTTPLKGAGRPLELPLDDIIEDPDQPRTSDNPGFSEESLAELAQSITESRGVKVPISVRPKDSNGKYLLNHGARRLRASRLAGMQAIRAFVDDAHDSYDQAIENIQRENFTPLEIAKFIDKRERAGDSRSTIATRLGKSNAYVTQHAALLKLPPPLFDLYDTGRCRDVNSLYQLGRLHRTQPEAVERLVTDGSEITRSTIEALKESSKEEPMVTGRSAQASSNNPAGEDVAALAAKSEVRTGKRTPTEYVIRVSLAGVGARLRPDVPPSADGLGFVEESESGRLIEIDLTQLRIESITHR